MKKYFLLIITLSTILLCSTAQASSGSWEVVGAGVASDGAASGPALFINNGTPYIAYSNKYDKVAVIKFDGKYWPELGSGAISKTDIKRPVIYVENGIPYVAFRNWTTSSKAAVMKYNGSSWEALSDDGITDEVSDVLSIYVDKGVPYIAYNDYNKKLSVIKYNGMAWEKVGSFGDDKVNCATLKISKGIPYIAYQNINADNKGTVKRFVNNKWQMIGNAIDMDAWSSYVYSCKLNYSNTYFSDLSLFIDNDVTYVMFTNIKKQASSVLLENDTYYYIWSRPKAIVMKLNGPSWEALGNVGFSSGKTGANNEGQVDQWSFYVNNGVPYVAYCDPNKKNSITVKKFIKRQWLPVGPAGFTTEQAENPSLYFHNDVPYVAFIDAKNGGRVTVMKYTGQLAKETSTIDAKKLALDTVTDMDKGYYKDAISKFDQVIDIDPDRSNLYALRGQCYEQLKDYPRAISNFETAIGLDPENWAAHYEKAICYFLNKEYHMTIWTESFLISLNINTPEAYAYRSYSYYRLKDYGKAWEELKKAQELGADVEPSFIEMLKTDSGGEPKMFFFF